MRKLLFNLIILLLFAGGAHAVTSLNDTENGLLCQHNSVNICTAALPLDVIYTTDLDVADDLVVDDDALISGTLTATEAVTLSAGGTITTGGLTITAGGLTVTAGGATVTAGDLTVTAGDLDLDATAAQIIGGATSLSLRNAADSADNFICLDAGTCTVRAGLTVTAGDLTLSGGTLVQTEKIVVPAALGHAGATATVGYVNTGTDNMSVTLAANATADTWVIPVTGLSRGDTITAFSVHGQIESAGNTATLDADLRKMTAVAADPTDASVGAVTQVSVTADTKVDQEKTGLAEVVAADESFYILVTCTTAAATDVQLLAAEVTVTRGNE